MILKLGFKNRLIAGFSFWVGATSGNLPCYYTKGPSWRIAINNPRGRSLSPQSCKNNTCLIPRPKHLSTGPLVVVLAVQDPQDREEQIKNVQIQANAGGNLFLDVVVSHDQLRVDENIAAEDQRRTCAVDEFHGRVVREERSHESEDDQDPQSAKKIGHPARKVVFALAGEEGEEDENREGDH